MEKHSKLLSELRTVGAQAIGGNPPELEELRRITPGGLVMAGLTFVAIYILLGQIGELSGLLDALKTAGVGMDLRRLLLQPFHLPGRCHRPLAARPTASPSARSPNCSWPPSSPTS